MVPTSRKHSDNSTPMAERLYAEHPDLYDAIQSEWPYDRDIAFALDRFDEHGVAGDRLLEIGCGTGEHTRRFADLGFSVTAIDKHEGMLAAAQSKCDATFRHGALPHFDLDKTYAAAVMLRGVVNHLPPEDLAPSIELLADVLSPGGLLVFDNSPLPPDGNHPGIDIGETPHGPYARIAQHVPTGDNRLDWRSITFSPEGDVIPDRTPMTPFSDDRLTDTCQHAGFEVEHYDGFGQTGTQRGLGEARTVFVCER